MHDSDLPTATAADQHPESDVPVTDPELDAIADDLDTVESAMKALDADDFDHAEALAASLGSGSDDTDTDSSGSDRTEPDADDVGRGEPVPDPGTSEA